MLSSSVHQSALADALFGFLPPSEVPCLAVGADLDVEFGVVVEHLLDELPHRRPRAVRPDDHLIESDGHPLSPLILNNHIDHNGNPYACLYLLPRETAERPLLPELPAALRHVLPQLVPPGGAQLEGLEHIA